LTRGHHHSSSDGINGVRGETGEDGDTPSNHEVDSEVVLDGSREERLDCIVETEVEPSVDDNTNAGNNETSVETSNTVGVDSFSKHINETIILLLATLLSALEIIGEFGSCKIERVHESK